MDRPKLLDLFCCAGGAAMGYYRAGFDVTGVDIRPQPHYPFRFIQADALTFPLEGYDTYHASPPCQGYSSHTKDDSRWVSYSQGKQTPKLIDPIRKRLEDTGKNFVIENVRGSAQALNGSLLLCGYMFGLPITRHRLFYCNVPILAPGHPNHNGQTKHYAQEHDFEIRDMSVTGKGRHSGCLDRWKQIMGIDWGMSQSEIVEAIPPAYTEYIGKYLLKAIGQPALKEE